MIMTIPVNEIFLSLGANLGNRAKAIEQAINEVKTRIGDVIMKSSLYETEAWGNTFQPFFLNQVIKIKSCLKPLEVLQEILMIEKKSGRIRTYKNAPRIIDIDILFFNKEVYDLPKLKIPHQEIQNRNFVLKPLEEIAPSFIHPGFNKSITDLLHDCKDELKVTKLEPVQNRF